MAHHTEGNTTYVDTDFVNDSQRIPGVTLKHMGFGEFFAETPKGRVDFDRMRGRDFPGQVGRSHKLYGDGAEWLVAQMERAGKSERMASSSRSRIASKIIDLDRATCLRVASELPKGDPKRRAILTALKTAGRLDGVRGHKLMPANLKSKIPDLYSQENEKDPMVWAKFFSPYTNALWLVTEFDGQDTMFGWADLGYGMGELGYISLSELDNLHRGGLPLVERDMYFRPKPLSKAKREG
jgi:hypothetical protein